MSCSACEIRIENKVRLLEGVEKVRANRLSSTVLVQFDPGKTTVKQIEAMIEKEGYIIRQALILESGQTSKNTDHFIDPRNTWTLQQWIGLVVVALAAYLMIEYTVGFNFIPEIQPSMGYGLIFAVGLLTSLHCIAMCGGISLSQCVSQPAEIRVGVQTASKTLMRPSFLYNMGRVISYTLIGGIVGMAGQVLSFNGTMRGSVAIFAGVFMILMGLNMTGLAPWAGKMVPKMPRLVADRLFRGSGEKRPFFVGLLNGLMPCGPLQSMQLYALGTGSFVTGALSMFFFSLGTVPLMFGFGLLSTLVSRKLTQRMLKISAILVVMLGVVMVGRGMSLSGISTATASRSNASADTYGTVAVLNGDVQEVTINITARSYEPIVVQKGTKVRFNLSAESENLNGCNDAIQIPAFGIQKSLSPGDNWVEFTPEETGVIPFSCWMGMIKSKITVVDSLGTTPVE
jgi:sulfite exporter TauE/SafE/copper chaperone CopZ